MRTLTAAQKIALLKAQKGGFALWNFIEISHPDMATPLRYVKSAADKVHLGNTYEWRDFSIAWPKVSRSEMGEGSITIDDSDKAITYFQNDFSDLKKARLTLFTVSNLDLDVKLYDPYRYLIKDILEAGNDAVITLTFDDRLKEAFPFVRYNLRYPGLHGGLGDG